MFSLINEGEVENKMLFLEFLLISLLQIIKPKVISQKKI